MTDGGRFDLESRSPRRFTMLVFYRGYHCPVCRAYAETLQRLLSRYRERGVEPVLISMDRQSKAEASLQEWDISDVPVAYGLSAAEAARWGLLLSQSIKETEPDVFSEPGLFLVRPDGTLYYAAVNSMPFGRPNLNEFLGSLDYIIENDYPARGTVLLERDPALLKRTA
jgi:peroxiredoxin